MAQCLFTFANSVPGWCVNFFGFFLHFYFFLPRQTASRMKLEPSLPYLYALCFCQVLVGGLYTVITGPIEFILDAGVQNPPKWGWQHLTVHSHSRGSCGVKRHRAAAGASWIGSWHRWKWTRCPVPVLVWMTGWDKLLQGVSKQQTLLFGSVFSVWCWLNNSVCNKQLMSIHLILEDTVNNRFYFPPSPNCCIEFHSL